MDSKEVLVVVSKVKKHIKEKHGMNTSSEVSDTLTIGIQKILDTAAERAKADGRKTVMGRDIIEMA